MDVVIICFFPTVVARQDTIHNAGDHTREIVQNFAVVTNISGTDIPDSKTRHFVFDDQPFSRIYNRNVIQIIDILQDRSHRTLLLFLISNSRMGKKRTKGQRRSDLKEN